MEFNNLLVGSVEVWSKVTAFVSYFNPSTFVPAFVSLKASTPVVPARSSRAVGAVVLMPM